MSNHVTYCLNVLKLNYFDSKKSATSWNTNINELGTMRGPISMLRTLNKLEDLTVLKRSPDLLNNVKIGQDQLQLKMKHILFYGGCGHFGQVT